MITLSIDVTQLDKARFKRVTRKNGQQAVYCELILLDTPDGQYGDFMVKQSISKAEREEGIQTPILGNAKHVVPVAKAAQSAKREMEKTHDDDGEEIPF